jgi:hypothetical protein
VGAWEARKGAFEGNFILSWASEGERHVACSGEDKDNARIVQCADGCGNKLCTVGGKCGGLAAWRVTRPKKIKFNKMGGTRGAIGDSEKLTCTHTTV